MNTHLPKLLKSQNHQNLQKLKKKNLEKQQKKIKKEDLKKKKVDRLSSILNTIEK